MRDQKDKSPTATLQQRIFLLPVSQIPLVLVFSLSPPPCASFGFLMPLCGRIMLDVESGAWEYMHIAVIYPSFADNAPQGQ